MKNVVVALTILALSLALVVVACSREAQEGPTNVELQAMIDDLNGRLDQLNTSIEGLNSSVEMLADNVSSDGSLEQRVQVVETQAELLYGAVDALMAEHGCRAWPLPCPIFVGPQY